MIFLITIQPLPEPPEPLNGSNLELDFIEAFTGIPNLTHAWNKFKLRTEVVDRLIPG